MAEIPSDNADVDFMSVLIDERDLLEKTNEDATELMDLLIAFYELDPDSDNALEEYTRIIAQMNKKQQPLAENAARLLQKEKEHQSLFRQLDKRLLALNDTSYTQVSKTAGMEFDVSMRANEVRTLENGLGSLKPIELDEGETLDLSLSKDELTKILDVEKRKRVLLQFENENILDPERRALSSKLEKMAAKDRELKEFLVDKVADMNKKVQSAKKSGDFDV